MENKTKKKQPLFLKFCQFIYLSFANFKYNMLWESAAACSFNFVFSFIPIIIIIFSILTWLVRFSPDVLAVVLKYADELSEFINIAPFVDSINNLDSISFVNIFDIVLAVWVVFMARKLFVSIVRAMNIIFRQAKDSKSKVSQVVIFLIELLAVLLIITVIIVAFIFNKILEHPIFSFFRDAFPTVISKNHNALIGALTYFLLFLSTFLIYRFVSQIKPNKRHCFFYAALSTSGTFVISFFLNKFLNTTNYNIVYGTISTVVIMMFKVYAFFLVFLFCAQLIFVSHNFDIMLQAEIYLLPEYDDQSIENNLKRILFINPTLIQNDSNTTFYKADDIIFEKGDKAEYVYYLKKGTVCKIFDNYFDYYDQGTFFGEYACLLNVTRKATVKAVTPCEILSIPTEDFLKMIKIYPNAANKALSKLSSFTENISNF